MKKTAPKNTYELLHDLCRHRNMFLVRTSKDGRSHFITWRF